MSRADKSSGFWLSDCGQYIARHHAEGNGVDYDVMTADGSKCWLAHRYEPKGFKDNDKRFTHPEFAREVISYSNKTVGRREAFKLGFADLDTSKRIKPYTGNCIIKHYEARFSRRMKMRSRPIKQN